MRICREFSSCAFDSLAEEGLKVVMEMIILFPISHHANQKHQAYIRQADLHFYSAIVFNTLRFDARFQTAHLNSLYAI